MINERQLLQLLQDLIAIPSVNPSLSPDEGHGEAPVAAFCRDWLQARGVEAWLEEVEPGRPNCIGRVRRGDGPTLILCGHLDTVATAGMTIPPFAGRFADGKVYGRGAVDMKGGVAACMAAAAALAAEPADPGGQGGPAGWRGEVLLALVADEEYASIGAEHFVRRYSGDACILTEPTDGKLIVAHRGFVWANITVRGTAAHGSRWDLGVSAISKMGRVIAALDEYDRTVLRTRTAPLVGPASMHCAVIHGGTGLSTYADRCVLQVERRTLPGETLATVEAELRGLIERLRADDPELHADVEAFFSRPPMHCPETEPIVAVVSEAGAAVRGERPPVAGVPFWMDSAIFAAAGIPSVVIGPAGEGLHAAVEWVDFQSVVDTAKILRESALAFCRGAAERR